MQLKQQWELILDMKKVLKLTPHKTLEKEDKISWAKAAEATNNCREDNKKTIDKIMKHKLILQNEKKNLMKFG